MSSLNNAPIQNLGATSLAGVRWLLFAFFLMAVLAGCSTKLSPTGTASTKSPVTQASTVQAQPSPSIPVSPIGFSTNEKWQDHFKKHGGEFGNITAEQYLLMAQQLRDSSPSQDILEIERKDHVTSRFERSSGNFLAFNRNRTIRTFFKPKDGERYFRRQAKKEHD